MPSALHPEPGMVGGGGEISPGGRGAEGLTLFVAVVVVVLMTRRNKLAGGPWFCHLQLSPPALV